MASKTFGTRAPRLSHVVHPGAGGISGEIQDLRNDLEASFTTLENLGVAGTGPFVVEEWTNPPAKDTDQFMVSKNFTAAAQVFTGTGLTGTAATPPRNVVVGVTIATTGGTGTITVKGLDVAGAAITETFAIPDATGTVVGNKAFASVNEVDVPAHGGLFTGSVIVGTGDKIGLAKKAKTRAGGVMVVQEIVDGSLATNGVFAVAATGLPNGTYAPNTIPNATHDYAVLYERDMA